MKRILLALVIASIAAGGVFAQSDDEEAKSSGSGNYTPSNTIAVDIGPLIVGLAAGRALSAATADEPGLSTFGIGIGVQYERDIISFLSVGGRFAYLGFGLGMDMSEEGIDASAAVSLHSMSFEGHARLYPTGGTFFFDGMLGLGLLTMGFDGEAVDTKLKETEKMNVSVSRTYFMLGAKIGWRVDFGTRGGFIFEPSFGFYGAFGLGDTIGQQLANEMSKITGKEDSMDIVGMDEAFWIMEKIILVGGPRFALNFGYKF